MNGKYATISAFKRSLINTKCVTFCYLASFFALMVRWTVKNGYSVLIYVDFYDFFHSYEVFDV